MSHPTHPIRHVTATVQDIWPATGLAYATDDNKRTWGLTRSTEGVGLEHLRTGQRLELTVVDHDQFDLVTEYKLVN
jgi:hypothetical protein